MRTSYSTLAFLARIVFGVLLAALWLADGAVDLSKLTGDEIVTVMGSLGDQCPPATGGRSWAPIPSNVTCGGKTARCNFPTEWCTYKPAKDGSPDLKSLKCQAMSAQCKKAFESLAKDEPVAPSASGTTPPAPHVPKINTTNSVIEPFGECCDYHEYCCFWASVGQCKVNKLFMVQLCQSSCGTCGCTKASLAECELNVAEVCVSGNITATAVCQCKKGHLIDRDWHENCTAWGQAGYCEKKSEFMRPMCKKTCGVCK